MASITKTVVARVRFSNTLPKSVQIALRAARQRINLALAHKFAQLTRTNFGPSDRGFRPAPWQAYSRAYAKRIRYNGPPTLFRTGVLFRSIQFSANPQTGTVSAEGARNYAAAQQFGSSKTNLPARPYFPVYRTSAGFQIFPPALKEMQREVDAELKGVLSK